MTRTESSCQPRLIREDQKRRAEESLEKALLEGLASAPPLEANRRYWQRKRRQLMASRANAKKPAQ